MTVLVLFVRAPRVDACPGCLLVWGRLPVHVVLRGSLVRTRVSVPRRAVSQRLLRSRVLSVLGICTQQLLAVFI